jgi:putative PIN family toxin of toxin-antitoxin system
MKIVLDTNVWISAFLFKGVSLRVVNFSVSNYRIYSSFFLKNELEDKLTNKFLLEPGLLTELMDRFKNLTYAIECTTPLPSACRDKDDNYILQICESSGHHYW